MTNLKIKYFSEIKGNYYWQPSTKLREHGWKNISLGNNLSTAIEKAEEQNRLLENWRKGIVTVPEVENLLGGKTLSDLIKAFLASDLLKRRSAKTIEGYQQQAKTIEEWGGDAPVGEISRAAVQAFYNSLLKKSVFVAYNTTALLRRLYNYAINQGSWEISTNPASRLEKVVPPSREVVWTRAEFDHLVNTALDMGIKWIADALYFGRYLGQRETDILNLTWDKYKNRAFYIKQHKTDRWVAVPAHKKLLEWMQEMQPVIGGSIICTFEGKSIKQSHFVHTFDKVRKEAAKTMPEVERLWFMDLRRTAVVHLAEAGCTVPEISAVTGHKIDTCQQILEVYLPRNDKMAENAILKLEQAG